MKSCRYIKISCVPISWESLLLSADSDFISYLVLASHDLDIATSLWLSQQTVEKYMKSLILKTDSTYRPQSDSHKLQDLWKKINMLISDESLLINKDYDVFINEISTVDVSSRYSFSIDIERILFPGKLIQFCDDLRKLILRENYSERGFKGLPNFLLRNDVRKIVCPIILTNGKSLKDSL